MELSILLIQEIVQLFIILFFGLLLVKTKVLNSSDSRVLSLLVLYVVTPCTIITSFSIKLTPDIVAGLGISFIAAIVVHVICIPLTSILSRFFDFNPIEKATIIYSNSGNLIIPLVGALLGKEWIIYTAGYRIVQLVLMWTHAKSLIYNEKNFNLKKIFLNINIITIIVGLCIFAFQIPLPSLVVSATDQVGSMVGPLAMLVIGMSIGEVSFKEVFGKKRAYFINAMRLLIYPVLMIVIFKLSGLANLTTNGNEVLLITILATCAPVAASITQFAQLYNQQPKYASALNVMSVAFSIITMPLMIALYQLL
jgi:predicted permease